MRDSFVPRDMRADSPGPNEGLVDALDQSVESPFFGLSPRVGGLAKREFVGPARLRISVDVCVCVAPSNSLAGVCVCVWIDGEGTSTMSLSPVSHPPFAFPLPSLSSCPHKISSTLFTVEVDPYHTLSHISGRTSLSTGPTETTLSLIHQF